jgi:hypothetical protein
MDDRVAYNRELGRRINQDIWNDRKLDLVETYFTEDFTHEGFSGRHQGLAAVLAGVEKVHATFEGFREVLKSVIADEERIVCTSPSPGATPASGVPCPPPARTWPSTRS